MGNKKLWEHYGDESPYYSVATIEQFKEENLNEDNLGDFFKSGEEYVETILQQIDNHLVKDFKSRKTLDFGCGVVRLTLALADKSEKVLGVDVSSTMVKEVKSNAKKKKISNVNFKRVKEELSDLNDKFDFVDSFIVIQHIDPKIGFEIVKK